MLPYHNIDPVAFSIASINVHWYGIMYLFAFLGGWFLLRIMANYSHSKFTANQVEDLMSWLIIGVLLGGRLGYIIFYDLPSYLESPWEIFQVWRGGMSFHGGFLGVLAVLYIWSRKHKKNFVDLTDFIAPAVPLGIFFGRMGNFINGELYGNVSNMPFAMFFPHGGPYPRHPSQLYEAFLEGLLLFLILWILALKPRKRCFISGVFCVGYATFRSFCELFRVPDVQYGYFLNYLTMGQILCIPMFLLGIYLIIYAKNSKVYLAEK